MIPRISGIKKCITTANYFKSLGIDLIHSFHYGADYSEALAAKIAGIPWIYTKKNMNWGGSSKNGWKLRTILATHIMVQNKDMLHRFFPNSNKTSLVPRGVDISEFKKTSKNLYLLKKYKINKDEIIILCVANLHPVKGVEVLIKAFNQLYSLNNNCRLFIVGDNDNDYGKNLIEFSKQLPCSHKVEFKGKVFNVHDYYSIADIFVLPTLNIGRVEGSPVALLEGISSGKKVLASDVSGIRDILGNFRGCLIEPGNVNALFKKLKNLVNDIKNGINNNNNVSQYIREHFNISVESKRHEKIYKKYFNN